MVRDWNLINGKWYYFNNSGKMETGWQFIDGEWYLLNNSGAMESSWKLENNKWYYMNEQGKMARGWAKINNQWYFFNQSGEMQTGWKLINKHWYFMHNSGDMLSSGIIDGWKINNNGVATVTYEKAKDILKSTLNSKPMYIEYDHMERGKTGEYEYYRLYASNKPRDKRYDNILDFYSVNKYDGKIYVG